VVYDLKHLTLHLPVRARRSSPAPTATTAWVHIRVLLVRPSPLRQGVNVVHVATLRTRAPAAARPSVRAALLAIERVPTASPAPREDRATSRRRHGAAEGGDSKPLNSDCGDRRDVQIALATARMQCAWCRSGRTEGDDGRRLDVVGPA